MSTTRPPRALPPIVQIVIVVAVAGVAVLAFFILSLISRNTRHVVVEVTPAPLPSGFFKPTDAQWRSLSFVRVKAMEFADVSETDGTIAPADDGTTQVFSPFTGRVAKVFVTVGDTVAKGQPLFSGEGAEYPQALNDLAAAVQTLDSARTALAVTAANRTRLLKLLRVDGAARKDVEQSETDLAAAQTAVRNDEVAVALVRSRLKLLGVSGGTGATPAASGSAPLPASAVVTAPISGIVTQRAVGPGQYVDSTANGASNVLLTISDLSRVFFVANVSEGQIGRVHVGDPVTVKLPAFPGRVFHADVRFIAPSVDPNLHRIPVRAEVDNSEGLLKPGMFGSFQIYSGASSAAVGVPEDAVIFEADTARVWVAGTGHTLALRYVRAGKTVDGMVEVSSGLRPGDLVVTSGSVFIDRAAQGSD
jgi:cobalt-zinc-cadmium efflux system membrane fusion protein